MAIYTPLRIVYIARLSKRQWHHGFPTWKDIKLKHHQVIDVHHLVQHFTLNLTNMKTGLNSSSRAAMHKVLAHIHINTTSHISNIQNTHLAHPLRILKQPLECAQI